MLGFPILPTAVLLQKVMYPPLYFLTYLGSVAGMDAEKGILCGHRFRITIGQIHFKLLWFQ